MDYTRHSVAHGHLHLGVPPSRFGGYLYDSVVQGRHAPVDRHALAGRRLFGITGGAHRLWAHRSYKASFAFRAITLLCNSIANQGTVYHWARDHRTHHFHSETCANPHDAGRGFFFAHMGWLFLKKDPRWMTNPDPNPDH